MTAPDSTLPAGRRRYHVARISGIPFLLALALLTLTTSGHAQRSQPTPHIDIPPPTPLPSPNAYDDLMRIHAESVEPRYDIWKPVSKILVHPPAPGTRLSLPRYDDPMPETYDRPNTNAVRRAALAKAEPALNAARAALAHHVFRAPSERVEANPYRARRVFRSLARSFAFESRMRENAHDYPGAVSSLLDGLELGVTVPAGAGTLLWKVGQSVEETATLPLWHLVGNLDAKQAGNAARRLADIASRRHPLSESITEDKWTTLAGLQTALQNETIQAVNSGLMASLKQGEDAASSVMNIMPPAGAKQPNFDEFLRTFTGQIEGPQAEAELARENKQSILDNTGRLYDYWAARSLQQYAAPHAPLPPGNDPFSRYYLMATHINAAWIPQEADSRLNTSLLITVLALHAYRLEHHALPASLDALTQSGLLRVLPADPFAPAPKTPLRYRSLDPTHFLLYSIGPDGVDDGGRPIDSAYSGGTRRTKPETDDKGDWVFGVNTPTGDDSR